MSENKMCPHCGGKMFMATITRACIVEVEKAKQDGGEDTYKILNESKTKHDISIVKCARCKESVKLDDLVVGVQCKECGSVVGPTELNEDGLCTVCIAKRERAELANASKEDLIRMLLEAERRTNPVASKMEKKIEKAEEIANASALVPVEDITGVAPEEAAKDKKAKRAKAPRNNKKATEKETAKVAEEPIANEEAAAPTEEAVVPETVNVEETVNDLASQQEAPFPEINAPEELIDATEGQVAVTEPEKTESPVPEESDISPQEAFAMFDDGEDPF